MIRFAKDHNYLLSVDEQTVESSLFATHPSRILEGDYRLMRLLIESEVSYRIEITEKNREQIEKDKDMQKNADLGKLKGLLNKR